MKLKLLIIIGLIFNVVLLNSCQPNYDEIILPEDVTGTLQIFDPYTGQKKQDQNHLEFTFSIDGTDEVIHFEAFFTDSILNSVLTFSKNSTPLIANSFKIDMADKEWRKKLNKTIEEKAGALKGKASEKLINKIDNVIDILPTSLYEKLQRNTYFSEASQSLFYHMATFKSARRANEYSQDDCQCTEYDPFQYKKSPFFCKEDKIVNANELHEVIENLTRDKEVAGKQFVPHISLDYLEKKSGEYISVSSIDRIFKDEFNKFWRGELSEKERQEVINANYSHKTESANLSANSDKIGEELWPYDPSCWLFGARTGGDCGCCMNYSGPCYYCSLVCYVHDQACEDCGWGCGPQCVQGPC